MSTLSCTYKEFLSKHLHDFRTVMTDPSRTDEEVAHAHKCLTLYYTGMEGTDDEIETAASFLQASTSEAIRRGWDIFTDTLGEY